MKKLNKDLSKSDFITKWKHLPEDHSERGTETAWRRYQQTLGHLPERNDPSLDELKAAFQPLVDAADDDVQSAQYTYVDGKRPPWTATHLEIEAGQEVSTFATGRLWRLRLLDLWLGPQFGLWFRMGENGTVFNSTQSTNTFKTEADAELYVATQFPGQFGDRSGRVQGPLRAYETADGGFSVIIIVWKPGIDSRTALRRMREAGDPFSLISTELIRPEQHNKLPADWYFLWFLGISNIFSDVEIDSSKAIRCRPHGNVGILQKTVAVPLTPDTTLSWDWLVSELPSRLREDTTLSHDYLSLAVEFENGRDLTYTWSWELPVDFGYWCPLATWCDREYHVVVRSGTKEPGTWLQEERNVSDDYKKYIGVSPPDRILRVWLIAGSRWQRNVGDMIIKNILLKSSKGATAVV